MKILLAVDEQDYSVLIIPEVARLSANTWADITIMSVQTSKSALDEAKADTLREYKEKFLAQVQEDGFPYAEPTGKEEFVPVNGGWQGIQASREGSKSCAVKVRAGKNTYKEIVAEAKEQESDLVVLGASLVECQWQGESLNMPQKVAQEAGCSVLVIKQPRTANKIIGCLDQSQISQESLEMVNQLVTLHKADLKIIGLADGKGLNDRDETESKMAEILSYYTAREINAWIKIVENNDLEEYVAKASQDGIIAVWMGKKSIFGTLFSENLVEKLLRSSHSSVLILR